MHAVRVRQMIHYSRGRTLTGLHVLPSSCRRTSPRPAHHKLKTNPNLNCISLIFRSASREPPFELAMITVASVHGQSKWRHDFTKCQLQFPSSQSSTVVCRPAPSLSTCLHSRRRASSGQISAGVYYSDLGALVKTGAHGKHIQKPVIVQGSIEGSENDVNLFSNRTHPTGKSY
jgi:hypothetical protein